MTKDLKKTIGTVETVPEVIETPRTRDEGKTALGTFVVINTNRIKGLRFNLANIRSYAMNGETSVQIGYDSGSTTLTYNSPKEAEEVVAFLDSYCL